MSIAGSKLTLQQERLAYRRAVRLSLSAFFHKTPSEAQALVRSWWQRMGNGAAFKTGLFMHDEPLKTAAALANACEIPAMTAIEARYLEIIRESMPKGRGVKKAPAHPGARAAHAA
jgi:hypothetical protein